MAFNFLNLFSIILLYYATSFSCVLLFSNNFKRLQLSECKFLVNSKIVINYNQIECSVVAILKHENISTSNTLEIYYHFNVSHMKNVKDKTNYASYSGNYISTNHECSEKVNFDIILNTVIGYKREDQTYGKNHTTIYVPNEYMYIFTAVKDADLQITFNGSTPVGTMTLDTCCWKKNMNSSCILEIKADKEIFSVSWNYWFHNLHGVVKKLKVHSTGRFYNHIQKPLYSICEQNIEHLKLCEFDFTEYNLLLPNMSCLKNFSITHSKLDKLDSSLFNQMQNLESLSLRSNAMLSITGINNLKNLNELNFHKNFKHGGLRKRLINEAHKLKMLKLIDLSDGTIGNKYLCYILACGKNIYLPWTTLVLNSNRIKVLPNDIFHNVPNITYIDISRNWIYKLSANIFENVKYLKYLNVSWNYIYTIPYLRFQPEVELEAIDFSMNKITFFPKILSVKSVGNLVLSHNNINGWNLSDIFLSNNLVSQSTFWLKFINVSYNNIHFITSEMIESFHYLNSVDLGGNDINCSHCTTSNLQSWLKLIESDKLTNFTLYNLGDKSKRLTCFMPSGGVKENVTSIVFHNVKCSPGEFNYLLTIIPLSTFVMIILVLCTITYKYRFEVAYLINYIKLKRRHKYKRSNDFGKYDYDIFVCYSKHDRWWVIDFLLPNIEEGPDKYAVCLHERDFPLGSLILENIETAMRLSRFTLVILSNSFVKSQWCRWELEMANYKLFEDCREFLILLELECLQRCSIPRHLKYLIETRTYLKWPEKEEPLQTIQSTIWNRLKKALGQSIHCEKIQKIRQRAYNKNCKLQVSEQSPLLSTI